MPKSKKAVSQFLGFSGHYRRFVKGFATISRLLNDPLVYHDTISKASKRKSAAKKQAIFEWQEEYRQSFESLIIKITSPPILAYANYRLPFSLRNDASLSGFYAVLYQKQASFYSDVEECWIYLQTLAGSILGRGKGDWHFSSPVTYCMIQLFCGMNNSLSYLRLYDCLLVHRQCLSDIEFLSLLKNGLSFAASCC